jgi:hypothetical protein
MPTKVYNGFNSRNLILIIYQDNNGPSIFAGFGGFKSAASGPAATGAFSFLSRDNKSSNGASS